ncbi:unnamed protein product [Acanthoscelides obtectus]|uniref:ENTH domain-containing protein n=1 Tax=Acanthoscelides obtectus TaxID=200917 RepID=A0A9P0K689_ACAOB|nr:unnamed protein product [Acanthoscelides obtectus]CAK1633216.1 Epsin-2 [Acanthoscelides obtectus]
MTGFVGATGRMPFSAFLAYFSVVTKLGRRLNDHGRNWRHVYKALVLLEYLIKTGSEKVGQQCKENIFAIQTLKDFQYLEEGKDQGQNVREKAKQLVNLLKDDERLKNERARALKAKERFAQSASGFGSDGGLDTPSSPRYPAFRGEWSTSRESTDLPRDIEVARPQTAGEEELQLQLALAMSREEAEQEEQKRKSDDVRLQLALSQSQQDFKTTQDKPTSHMVDLLDVNLGDTASSTANVDAWGFATDHPRPQMSPSLGLSSPESAGRGSAAAGDPWAPVGATAAVPKPDPWGGGGARGGQSSPAPGAHSTPSRKQDPWSPASQSSGDLEDFDVITNRNKTSSPKLNGASSNNNASSDPFELNLLGDSLPPVDPAVTAAKKTPLSFLGENSALVNLDNLVTATKPNNPAPAANPFSDPAVAAATARPIFNQNPPKPSINEMKQQSFASFAAPMPPAAGFSTTAFSTTPQFTAGFGTNGNAFAPPPVPVMQDPWTPIPSSATQSSTASPWKANEPANPFLS